MKVDLETGAERLQRLVLDGSGHALVRFSFFLAIAVLICLIIVAAATLVDITLRAFTSYTVRGLFELSGLFMAIIISGLISLVFLHRRNISVDVMRKMAGSNQLGVHLVSAFSEAVIIIGLAVVLGFRALDAYEYGEKTMVVGWSTTGLWITACVMMSIGAVLVVSRNVAQWGRLIVHKAYQQPGFWRGLGVVFGAVALSALLLFLYLTEDTSPSTQAGIGFLALYILIAAQIPIGVALALLGVSSLALTLGAEQALVIAQNEVSRALTSKSAVIGFTKALARELAPLGVTANVVSPGLIETPMLRAGLRPENDDVAVELVPLSRIGQAEEVAAAVAYLLSEKAAYVTGSTLDVNGGYYMA